MPQLPEWPQPAGASAESQSSRASALSFDSPLVVAHHTGSFVALSAKHELQVDVNHEFLEGGSSAAVWTLYVAPAGTSPISPRHQYDALGANVQKFKIGGGAGGKVQVNGIALVTGLTPGRTYNWELCGGATGGLNSYGVTGAAAVGVASKITPAPESANVIAIRGTDGKVSLFRLRGFQEGQAGPELMGSVALAAQIYGRIAVSPDGQKIVCPLIGAAQVAVINTNASKTVSSLYTPGTWAPAQIVGSPFTVPGVNPNPWGVAITPDSLYAWVTLSGTGQLVRITLADGTVGAPIALAGAGGDIAITPDGLYAFVPRSGGNGISKVRLSDGAIVAGGLAGASCGCVAIDPQGTYVYTNIGTTLYKLNVADCTLAAGTSSGTILGNLARIAVFPDGNSLLLAHETTSASQQVRHHRADDLSLYVNFTGSPSTTASVIDLAIGPYGSFIVPCSGQNSVFQWPGGRITYDPTSTFYGHDMRVLSRQLS